MGVPLHHGDNTGLGCGVVLGQRQEISGTVVRARVQESKAGALATERW